MWKCALLLSPPPWVPFKLWVLNVFLRLRVSNATTALPKQTWSGMSQQYPMVLVPTSLLFTFFCCDKHYNQKQLAQGRLYFILSCSSSWREVRAGTLGTCMKELKQRLWRNVLHGLLSMLFYTTQGCLPRHGTPTVGWVLPHQSLRKCPYRLAYRPSWGRRLLNLDFLF